MVATAALPASARAFGVLVASVAAANLFSSGFIGMTALALAAVVCVAPRRSFDAAAMFGAWALTAVMFGLPGAGCLILAQTLAASACALVPRGARAQTALLVFTAAAALLACGYPALAGFLGASGLRLAELVAICAIGAPALALGRIAQWEIGETRYEALRVGLLAPQYLALVAGAALGGLPGAAAGLAFGALSAPVIALSGTPGGLARHGQAFGVLAAGLVASLAMAAVPDVAAWATVPAGAAAGFVALRVHAPEIAAALADEIRPVAVLFRDRRDRDRPFELETRIVEPDAALRAGGIGLGDHVGDLGMILERKEAVRETGREIEKLPLR